MSRHQPRAARAQSFSFGTTTAAGAYFRPGSRAPQWLVLSVPLEPHHKLEQAAKNKWTTPFAVRMKLLQSIRIARRQFHGGPANIDVQGSASRGEAIVRTSA
jgi:hypothetical protein